MTEPRLRKLFLQPPHRSGLTGPARAAAALLAVAAVTAGAQANRAAGVIHGYAADSVRGRVLAGAFVELMPTGRQVATDSIGRYRFEGVPPAPAYRLRVMHALLDTLGIGLMTPTFPLDVDETRRLDVSTPSAASLLAALCGPNPAMGPAALVGFVHDPDTGAPIDSAVVSLVYDESPIIIVKWPVSRTARVDATGRFRICGLPARMDGHVQLSRNGMLSGDIPVSTRPEALLAIRALGMSLANQRVTTAVGVAAPGAGALRGDGTVKGRVVSSSGEALDGASVQVEGSLSAATTDAEGRFVLSGVPTGTQSVVVRKIGYNRTTVPVDVVRHDSADVRIVMGPAVTVLDPVVAVSQRSRDLDAVGFTRRKSQGLGFFIEGDRMDRSPPTLAEALRLIPGLHVGTDARNQREQKAMVMSSRDSRGCVRYIVDDVPFQEGLGADIERFVRPYEIEAMELYNGATVPGEFSAVSKGKCAVLVIWTRHKIRSNR